MLESSNLQGLPELLVRLGIEGINVVANSSNEELRVLRDDTEPRAQILDADRVDVNAVDQDLTVGRGFEAVESRDEAERVLFEAKRW